MSDLQTKIERLTDVHEIANTQGRYMYYVQHHDYERIVDLFAAHDPDVSAEIAESGVYVGLAKIRSLFVELIKPFFTGPGVLPIHMLTTPVIEVDPQGHTARAMWQTLGCNAFPTPQGLSAAWQQGKYDNIFVKEEGVWRFKQFRWLCNFRTAFDQGWVRQPLLHVAPLDLRQFPPHVHPTRAGEPYRGYRPDEAMDFGPRPPPAVRERTPRE
jgi:SnoaL-like domain